MGDHYAPQCPPVEERWRVGLISKAQLQRVSLLAMLSLLYPLINYHSNQGPTRWDPLPSPPYLTSASFPLPLPNHNFKINTEGLLCYGKHLLGIVHHIQHSPSTTSQPKNIKLARRKCSGLWVNSRSKTGLQIYYRRGKQICNGAHEKPSRDAKI